MKTLGTVTKNIFLKEVADSIIHEEFDVVGRYQTLTFSAALVTSNTINGYVGGVAISQVTFATDSDTTMAAVAAAIAAANTALVKSATVVNAGTSDRVINIVPVDPNATIALDGFVVAAGGSQATVTAASVDSRIFKGQLVEINQTVQFAGKIQPLTTATASTTLLGVALQDAVEGQLCTVICKGMGAQVWGEASITSMLPGPVAGAGFNSSTLYGKYTSTSVTATNIVGQCLDSGTSVGDLVRVILR